MVGGGGGAESRLVGEESKPRLCQFSLVTGSRGHWLSRCLRTPTAARRNKKRTETIDPPGEFVGVKENDKYLDSVPSGYLRFPCPCLSCPGFPTPTEMNTFGPLTRRVGWFQLVCGGKASSSQSGAPALWCSRLCDSGSVHFSFTETQKFHPLALGETDEEGAPPDVWRVPTPSRYLKARDVAHWIRTTWVVSASS